MTTRDDSHRTAENAGETLPDEHQGFVRSGDVHDTDSQAAAPRQPARAFDRSGEKHYEVDLRQFEREHPDADQELPGARTLDDHGTVREAIRRALAHDDALREVDVQVGGDGVVTLSGAVADAGARRRAHAIAVRASGGNAIVDHITVRA